MTTSTKANMINAFDIMNDKFSLSIVIDGDATLLTTQDATELLNDLPEDAFITNTVIVTGTVIATQDDASLVWTNNPVFERRQAMTPIH